ncbi:hypothetical protein BKA65DRAFT_517711 [Rhexocercosporidium sp. MPI-PUGE-AT-0058]|nr:hypothetical protein BKA65DRAFT_517711 [Rhexocercosporidium sp. MPI-PUGE-AT-0058]
MSLLLAHPTTVSSPVVIDTFGAIQVISSRADVQTNLFLNPPSTGSNGPDNSEWSLGTQQQLRWKTNITNYDLMLYQQLVCSDNNCVNGPVMIKDLKSDTSTFVWTVSTGSLSLSPTNTFFLIIRDVENELNQFGSSYLNFTKGVEAPANTAPPARSSPTTVVVASTLSPSSSSTTTSKSSASSPAASETSLLPLPFPTSTSTSTSSSTATALPISSPSRGLSTGAKVGMVIGTVSVVVIAILLGWYLGRRRKIKSKKSPFHPFETPAPAPPVQLSELHVPGWGEQKPIPPPFTPRELHGKGKFDSFTGVRELDAWEKPGEFGDGRRPGVKSGVYELGPRYT